MNRTDEEAEEEDDDDDNGGEMTIISVDQFPSVRPPSEFSNHSSGSNNNNICSSKQPTSEQIVHTKYQLTNRSTSLPSRQTFSSNINIEENKRRRRRRYASDSNNNNKTLTTSLVTSFIQYLRSELRATTNDQKHDYKKSIENVNYLSETFNLSNNFYRQQYPIRMNNTSISSSSSSSSQSIEINLNHLSNENLLKNHDDNEILKLINLLILRVECLANENTLIHKNTYYPTIKQVDQNLIEYIYYLFNKFIRDESELNTPMINKTKFVNVCQTLVRNGCFNIPSSISPDQSFSEATITNSSEQTLTQTFIHEYKSETDNMSLKTSCPNEQITNSSNNDQETWLVVDLEPIKPIYSMTTPDESKCLLPSSTSDEQLLFPNENYFSFEEIKSSCESESSQSNYYSPNSSLIDLQNMVQEFDEINNTNNNNNTLYNEDGSSITIEHASNNTNDIIEATDMTNKNSSICTGLILDCKNEHISSSSSSSSMEAIESLSTKQNEKISRRERKMQERWTISTQNETNNTERLPTKTFLGVEFPPIAVLRRKFSSLPPSSPSSPSSSSTTISNSLPIKKTNCSIKTKTLLNQIESNNPSSSNDHISSAIIKSSMSLPLNQEINTSIVDKTKHDQVLDLQSNDTSLLNDSKNNDIQPSLTSVSELLTDEKNVDEDLTRKIEQEHISSSRQIMINSDIFNLSPSSSISSSSSLLSMSSSSTTNILMTNANEKKTVEFLLKEIEEEKKNEEEHCDDDNDNDANVDIEKKNNYNVEHIDHASGTILINSEPIQVVLLEQEKETEQPCNQLQPEDELSTPILSNNFEEITMSSINPIEERYKTVEIEEIPDEDDDLSIHNNSLIEPIDCILTDDELKLSPKQANTQTTKNISSKIDTVLSCHEKSLSNTVETMDDSTKSTDISTKGSQMPPLPKRSQRPEDDPIALRALQRFEERMNAAAAAAATKTNNDETSPSTLKGKSSWSGTLSTSRKSVENLFKPNQQSTSASNDDELSPQRDTFIRPRKTLLDDIGLNLGMTLNLFGNGQSNSTINNDNHQKIEEQHQPIAIVVDDDNKQNEPTIATTSTTTTTTTLNMIDSEDSQQSININSSIANESSCSNDADNSNSLPASSLNNSSTDSSLNTVISHLSPEQQQSLTPYRLQLEGRRRLNTLERIRERHQNHQSNDVPQQQQQQLQLQNEYTLKPEDLQDPIIRRALERFDEKSRSLTRAKTPTYDDIQDPITRRALMRLETNLKRTIPPNPPLPPSSTNIDSNDTWYTNSYTLGSLQSNNDNRFIRYPDSSLSSTLPHKPSHISVHQRFCSTSSSDMSELSTNNILANNDQNIPIMRVPTQPIYVTSNNQPPISFRQRSRSEDMLSSRDLSIGQTTNFDDNETSQLQRNHSSNELQQQETSISNETDFPLSNTIIQNLDQNFIRSPEASVNYATPVQSYSGYNCEYTRPHQNQSLNTSKSDLFSSKNLQQENEIQTSSAFLPVHPSTNNYYSPPQAPSYNSMYTTNNLNQTPYSDDPIVRRALERFNCQMQNSLMSMSQHQPNMNYMSRQFSNGYPTHQGNFDVFHPVDQQQHDGWINSHRSMPPPPPPPPSQPSSNTTTGYQSIIGRRRHMRHDDIYHDTTNIGNGYSSSLFVNSQNSYPYMNYSDEPPDIPPRLHRDLYHEQQEYLSENMNNNNNNNGYVHHMYSGGGGGTINGYHPMNYQYIPGDYFQQIQDEEYLRHRAQSTSSNTSSDSINQIRLMQQRLPPTSTRINFPQNKNISPDHSQLLSGQTTPSNGSTTGDSVFHRLAYTATKSSLSKSSSNLCANLVTKPPPSPQQQQQQQQPNKSKPQEINDEESITNNEPNSDSTSLSINSLNNKCQRSRSVDGRARLKNAQTRLNTSARSTNDYDDNNTTTTVPSSKFTSINSHRNAPPPRVPITSRSIISDRISSTKRATNGNHLPYTKTNNGNRIRGSNGNLIDTDNEENLSLNDSLYQPKIIDNKTRTSIPAQRYSTTNNYIQTSASTSSVNSTHSRTRLPISASTTLDRRDSNISNSDLSRLSKRSDDNRLLSPNGQRRTIPVSVFVPAKHENKSSISNLPSSTSPTNEVILTNNNESQQEQQTFYSSSIDDDNNYTTLNNENESNNKLLLTNSTLKSSSGNLLNDHSLTHDKHDTNKKMNVFERLFRGHKKKV